MLTQIIENILVPAEDYIYGFANLAGLLDEEDRINYEFQITNYGVSSLRIQNS